MILGESLSFCHANRLYPICLVTKYMKRIFITGHLIWLCCYLKLYDCTPLLNSLLKEIATMLKSLMMLHIKIWSVPDWFDLDLVHLCIYSLKDFKEMQILQWRVKCQYTERCEYIHALTSYFIFVIYLLVIHLQNYCFDIVSPIAKSLGH